MNPHHKETWFSHYSEEKEYKDDKWFDTGLWVEVGGLGLVICTVSLNTGWSCNVGFRIINENDEPLQPYRKKTNTRHSAHFSFEPNPISGEDMSPVTFHIIANCQCAKLQIRPSDASGGNAGIVRLNSGVVNDATWHHKPITTMTAIPLVPSYQGGASTIFTYPRAPQRNEKLPKPLKKHSSQGNY